MFFKKYTALGNVYIVIDPLKNDIDLDKKKIEIICDHFKGLGSDGIMYGPIFDDKKNISCKIFNPDGSEAEKSGNGTRIFAQYLLDENYINQDSDSVLIKTKEGDVFIKFLNKKQRIMESEIGFPSFRCEDIDIEDSANKNPEYIQKELQILDRTFIINCVSVGNPHCVTILENISPDLAKKYGTYIENHNIFKNRINVQFVKIINKKTAEIEIWERGAGYTMSSGTSSAAVGAILKKLNLIENEVSLKMPGGIVKVNINKEGKISILGTVNPIAEGNLLLEF